MLWEEQLAASRKMNGSVCWTYVVNKLLFLQVFLQPVEDIILHPTPRSISRSNLNQIYIKLFFH